MTIETYSKIHSLIIRFGNARFLKGVADLNSDLENESNEESKKIFKEIDEILISEVTTND